MNPFDLFNKLYSWFQMFFVGLFAAALTHSLVYFKVSITVVEIQSGWYLWILVGILSFHPSSFPAWVTEPDSQRGAEITNNMLRACVENILVTVSQSVCLLANCKTISFSVWHLKRTNATTSSQFLFYKIFPPKAFRKKFIPVAQSVSHKVTIWNIFSQLPYEQKRLLHLTRSSEAKNR